MFELLRHFIHINISLLCQFLKLHIKKELHDIKIAKKTFIPLSNFNIARQRGVECFNEYLHLA